MPTPWAASGLTRAARAAASLSRPMPRRPSPKRLQKDASMVPRCAGRPGVPASPSRKGAFARTSWLTFSRSWPTSRASVCASSSRTTTGLDRQRAINRSVRFCRDGACAAHSASPTPATPTFTGSTLLRGDAGRRRSTSACSVRMRLGVKRAMSTRSARRQARSNQVSNTVLPLPRGPISATSCGGALPSSRSARHCNSTASSRSRPVSAGGTAPSPGVNTRRAGSFTPASIRHRHGVGRMGGDHGGGDHA